MPWSFKLLYGLLSDCVPIMGKRRKPYFIAGWSIYVLSNLVLMATKKPNLNQLLGWVSDWRSAACLRLY